jgi:SAM-dependent methyltransferase
MTELRATFDRVPELYDRARPDYPPEIFDDLATLAQLPAPAWLLEIGCGTGQATLPLARRGYALTCVELGERVASFARRKLAPFPSVEVINAEFESWQPESGDFDAVVAFSSFHWLPPELRYVKSADLLREHGHLAFVSVAHVLPAEGDPFFVAVQDDYEAVVPDDPMTKAGAGGPPHPDAMIELSDTVVRDELEASGRFRPVVVRHYLWDLVYTADEYVALLNTYSGHIALDGETRTELGARIHRRIEAQPAGTVRKTYLALLYVAERL